LLVLSEFKYGEGYEAHLRKEKRKREEGKNSLIGVLVSQVVLSIMMLSGLLSSAHLIGSLEKKILIRPN
jgi:hypothetical protein